MQKIDIELYTGRKLTIRELNGLEEQNITDMLPPDKFMSHATYIAIAAITAMDGEQLPRASGMVELKERLAKLAQGEKAHLMRIIQKRFGAPLEADDLGNVSSVAEPEPVSAS